MSVNAAGGTPVVQRYLPYGTPRSTSGGTAVTDSGWIGQTKDSSTGLQYLNARYEAGTSAPTLDALRNIAIALGVTTYSLVFEPDERGPTDTDLRLHLEALDHLDPDEQTTIKQLIEAILLRHQARRLAG